MKVLLTVLITTLLTIVFVSCGKNYKNEKLLVNGGKEWTLSAVMIPSGTEFNSDISYETNKFLSFRYSDFISLMNHQKLVLEIWDNNGVVDRYNWSIEDDGKCLHLSKGDNIYKDYCIDFISKDAIVLVDKSSPYQIKYKYVNRYDNIEVEYIMY